MVGASVLGLSACGGTMSSDNASGPAGAEAVPDEVVALAAGVTAGERMRVALEVPLDLAGEELPMRTAGVWDLALGRGELAMTPENYTALRDARISAFVWDRLIVDGGSWYTHHPDLGMFVVPEFEAEAAGRSWVRWAAQRPLFGLPDPTEALLWLRERPATVEEVGPEELDGADTRHYRMTFDPAPFRAGDGNFESAVVEVWVGTNGLIRRLAAELTYEQGGVQPTYVVRGAYTFSDPGIAVELELPPEAEVIAEDELYAHEEGGPAG